MQEENKLVKDLYNALVVNYKTSIFGTIAVVCGYVLANVDSFGGHDSVLVAIAQNIAMVSGIIFSIVSQDTASK